MGFVRHVDMTEGAARLGVAHPQCSDVHLSAPAEKKQKYI
jgi:hypothetical protein